MRQHLSSIFAVNDAKTVRAIDAKTIFHYMFAVIKRICRSESLVHEAASLPCSQSTTRKLCAQSDYRREDFSPYMMVAVILAIRKSRVCHTEYSETRKLCAQSTVLV